MGAVAFRASLGDTEGHGHTCRPLAIMGPPLGQVILLGRCQYRRFSTRAVDGASTLLTETGEALTAIPHPWERGRHASLWGCRLRSWARTGAVMGETIRGAGRVRSPISQPHTDATPLAPGPPPWWAQGTFLS